MPYRVHPLPPSQLLLCAAAQVADMAPGLGDSAAPAIAAFLRFVMDHAADVAGRDGDANRLQRLLLASVSVWLGMFKDRARLKSAIALVATVRGAPPLARGVGPREAGPAPGGGGGGAASALGRQA